MPSSQRSKSELFAPDLILLLLVAPTRVAKAKDRLSGITRLEKLLYLTDKETGAFSSVKDAFEFEPYDYGPFSKAVYEAVELLEQAGLLTDQRKVEEQALDEMEELAAVNTDREGVERQFELTENGLAVAGLLARENPAVAGELSKIKDKYAGMPLRRLIQYVYTRYPEDARRSKIRDIVS